MELIIVLFILIIIGVISSVGGRLDESFTRSAWRKTSGKPSRRKIDPDKFEVIDGEIVEKKGYKMVIYEIVCPYCHKSFIKHFSDDLSRVECKSCRHGFASDDLKLQLQET